jgi:hypothetical protein
MAAAQLRLLAILALELITNAVQKLNVALVRVLLQARDESPGHGTRGLTLDRRIGSVSC